MATAATNDLVLDFVNDRGRPERLCVVVRETGQTLYTFTETGRGIWRRPIEVQKEVSGGSSPLTRQSPYMTIKGRKLQVVEKDNRKADVSRRRFLRSSGSKKVFQVNGIDYTLEKQAKKTIMKMHADDIDVPLATFGTESIFDSTLATIRILPNSISRAGNQTAQPAMLLQDGKPTLVFDMALCAFALYNAGKLSKAWTSGSDKYEYMDTI